MRDTNLNDHLFSHLFSLSSLSKSKSAIHSNIFQDKKAMLDSFQRRTLPRRRDSYEQFNDHSDEKKKSRFGLIRLSAIVCGIEFCYAAETAFVSPILLQIGLPIMFMTWAWCLPSIIGFFLVPILGSLSDKCSTRFGRRRPFILLYSIGILLGLFFIAKGKVNDSLRRERKEFFVRSSLGTSDRRSVTDVSQWNALD